MKASDIDRIVDAKAGSVLPGELLARVDGPGRAPWRDLPAAPGIYAVCLTDWKDRAVAADAGRARYTESADPRPEVCRPSCGRPLTWNSQTVAA